MDGVTVGTEVMVDDDWLYKRKKNKMHLEPASKIKLNSKWVNGLIFKTKM